MRTFSPRPGQTERKWNLVDASGQQLGRLAVRIAQLLKGKHKPTFAPHVDGGDFVVVINANEVRLSGKKLAQATRYRHSGYPGGLKAESLAVRLSRHPGQVVEQAVKGMLPHTVLGRAMLRRLKVYAGSSHPYEPQVGVPAASVPLEKDH